jgi:type-F conjugative transfer system pilin assembly protein TrbC
MGKRMKRFKVGSELIGVALLLMLSGIALLAQAEMSLTMDQWRPPTPSINMTLFNPPALRGEVLIFISSSMPKASLVQWFEEAKQLGAAIILTGFINNSLLETEAYFAPIFKEVEESGIEINPTLFDAYHITAVPAVVVTTGSLACNSIEPPSFDRVMGNTSLSAALKIIAEKGELGSIAKQKLAQLKGKS